MAFSGPLDAGVFHQENGIWKEVSNPNPAHNLATMFFSVLVAYFCRMPITATMSKQILWAVKSETQNHQHNQ